MSSSTRATLRQLVIFGAIGVVSTGAYAVLYLAFRSGTSAGIANALALVVTAIGNTAANRRLTFGVRDREHLLRDYAAGFAAFGLALAITTVAATALGNAANVSRTVELAVLVAANAIATVLRFVILRFAVVNGQQAVRVRERVG